MRSPHDASQSTGHDSAGSHSVRRHTRNKKSDPFLELSNDIDVNADQPFPRSPKGENGEDVDSLFADVRRIESSLKAVMRKCLAD